MAAQTIGYHQQRVEQYWQLDVLANLRKNHGFQASAIYYVVYWAIFAGIYSVIAWWDNTRFARWFMKLPFVSPTLMDNPSGALMLPILTNAAATFTLCGVVSLIRGPLSVPLIKKFLKLRGITPNTAK